MFYSHLPPRRSEVRHSLSGSKCLGTTSHLCFFHMALDSADNDLPVDHSFEQEISPYAESQWLCYFFAASRVFGWNRSPQPRGGGWRGVEPGTCSFCCCVTCAGITQALLRNRRDSEHVRREQQQQPLPMQSCERAWCVCVCVCVCVGLQRRVCALTSMPSTYLRSFRSAENAFCHARHPALSGYRYCIDEDSWRLSVPPVPPVPPRLSARLFV